MASKDTHRKLTAILCAEVVGYSRLMGDEYASIGFCQLRFEKFRLDSCSSLH